jgi:DNA-directed RNA polymerase III subunit RPC6
MNECQQSFPPGNPEAIYSSSYTEYPTLPFLHKWIRKSGITSVELAVSDVACLVDRLVYDGKIIRLRKPGSGGDLSSDYKTDSEWEGDERVVGDLDAATWMYKAVRSPRDQGNVWTDIPCGKCPVFEFCREGGPVNPESCVYYKTWLSDLF